MRTSAEEFFAAIDWPEEERRHAMRLPSRLRPEAAEMEAEQGAEPITASPQTAAPASAALIQAEAEGRLRAEQAGRTVGIAAERGRVVAIMQLAAEAGDVALAVPYIENGMDLAAVRAALEPKLVTAGWDRAIQGAKIGIAPPEAGQDRGPGHGWGAVVARQNARLGEGA